MTLEREKENISRYNMHNIRGKQSPSTPHQKRQVVNRTAWEEGESLLGTGESPKKCGSRQRVIAPLWLPSEGESDGAATLDERAASSAPAKPESLFGSVGAQEYGGQDPKQQSGWVKFGHYRGSTQRSSRPVPYPGLMPCDREAQTQGGSGKHVLMNNNRHPWMVSKEVDNDKEILKIKEYRISNQSSSKPRCTPTNCKMPSGPIQHDDYEELLAKQMNSMHLQEEFMGLANELHAPGGLDRLVDGSPSTILPAGTRIQDKLGASPGDETEKLKEVFHRVCEFLNPEVALWQRALQVVETLIAENGAVASDKKMGSGLLLRVAKRPSYSILFRLEYNHVAKKSEPSLIETKAWIENKIRSLDSSRETVDPDDKKNERLFLPPVSSANGPAPEVELPDCGQVKGADTRKTEAPKDHKRSDIHFEELVRLVPQ